VRPHHDITHPESDPAETIHFLRNSNIEWQATAERVARQRDEAQAQIKAFEDFCDALKGVLEARDLPDNVKLGAAREALVTVLDTVWETRS
jgi:hypothetical protein